MADDLAAQVYAAARSGDESRLLDLLAGAPEGGEAASPVDALNEEGFTPLHASAAFGHVGCAKLLLERGADVNVHGIEDRRTALHHAACFGRAEVIRLLAGVEGVNVEARDNRGCTPLHLAAAADEGECIAALLAAGTDVEAKAGVSRCSALHLAAGSGATDNLRLLLDAGADLLDADGSGCTALHVAAICGFPETVAALLAAARAEGRAEELVGIMDTEDMRTALHKASLGPGDCVETLRLLLDAGADVDERDAARHGFSALHLSAGRGLRAVSEALLARGARPNAADNVDGVTPLTLAAAAEEWEVASRLVAAGCHDGENFEGAESQIGAPALARLLPAARSRLRQLRGALSGRAPQPQPAAEPGEPRPPQLPAEAAEWLEAQRGLAEAAFALQSHCGAEASEAAWEWREAAQRVRGAAEEAGDEPPAEGSGRETAPWSNGGSAAAHEEAGRKRRRPLRWRELVLAKGRAAARFAERWAGLAEAAVAYDQARAAAEGARGRLGQAEAAQARAVAAKEGRCAAAGLDVATPQQDEHEDEGGREKE